MPALEYYARDPVSGSIRPYGVEEMQQLLADTSKPVFFSCLGMDGFSGKTNPERQIRCVEGFFDGHKPEEFHVIAIINGEKKFTDNKLSNYLHRFNGQFGGKPSRHDADNYHNEYEQPATFGMQLLKEVLDPLIPYVGYMGEKAHNEGVQQAKLKLSQCNFFGHSFGTVVLAEAFDYLRQTLHNKGFSEQEAEDCLNCMGRLNVGNSYHITERLSAVPGIDYNSALDRITEKYNNVPQHRDSPVLVTERIGNSLLLSPLTGASAVPSIRLKATEAADDEERRTFTSRVSARESRGDKPSPWDLIVEEISDSNQHALQLYMYKERMQTDPQNGRARLTGQASPGAEIANVFMMDLFNASRQAQESRIPRDTRRLVSRVQEQLASPAVRDALADGLAATQERFHRHFGTDLPSR